jgi:hypothetical protein
MVVTSSGFDVTRRPTLNSINIDHPALCMKQTGPIGFAGKSNLEPVSILENKWRELYQNVMDQSS